MSPLARCRAHLCWCGVQQWAVDFDKWVEDGVIKTGKEREDHFATFKQHPLIHDAHPRVEHFVPLLPLVGVSG